MPRRCVIFSDWQSVPVTPIVCSQKVADYLTTGAHLVGAYDGDHLVGVLGFRAGSTRLVMKHLATRPSLRNCQVGRSLVEWLATRCPDHPIVAKTDSVGFYRRLGFSVSTLGEKYPGVERFAVRRDLSVSRVARDQAP
jgi:GNAT superfamily N-acetyltransferase